MKSLLVPLLIFAASGTSLYAQTTSLQPGEYLDGKEGFLLIKPAKTGGLPFEIQTVGPNRHVCEVQGVIGKDGRAVLKQDGETCRVVFAPKADGVEVTPNERCSGNCGVRASFDGMYYKPEAGCERAGVRKTRAEFKRLYDKKAYADARSVLEPVLTKCRKTLDSNTEDWIRNDLAIAFFRLGDSASCRKLLEPLAKDAAKPDAVLREDMLPSDAERYMPIARATRTNLKLCAGK
jgi:hypothetical protein